jgi:fatty acid desaturase
MQTSQLIEPQIDILNRELVGVRWPTYGVFALAGLVWGGALCLPAGWGAAQCGMLVFALTLHSSLSHEILHGGFFRSARANDWLGVFQPGLFVPYLRFRALHLAHHRDADLTDPYDDPESAYLDPRVWDRLPDWLRGVLGFNNTLLGRMVVGPVIGMADFLRGDLRAVAKGDAVVIRHWLAHLPGVGVTLWLVSVSSMTFGAYFAACYAALSVLRIRTFLEHRAHERSAGRSVVIEDRGILAFLFLNNSFHAVHHAHPQVAWYHLPMLYRSGKDKFLLGNQDYVYRSYGQIIGQYFLRAKDPVAHPLWQPKDD